MWFPKIIISTLSVCRKAQKIHYYLSTYIQRATIYTFLGKSTFVLSYVNDKYCKKIFHYQDSIIKSLSPGFASAWETTLHKWSPGDGIPFIASLFSQNRRHTISRYTCVLCLGASYKWSCVSTLLITISLINLKSFNHLGHLSLCENIQFLIDQYKSTVSYTGPSRMDIHGYE